LVAGANADVGPVPARLAPRRHRSLLLGRVDLHERRADIDALARLHEDARDQPFRFWLNRRRTQRPQGRDEV
jgi:hypothetical protein